MDEHFKAEGWHTNICDDDIVRKLYLKLTLGLKWQYLNTSPVVEDHLLQTYIPENFHTDKVTAFVTFKDKIFLSLANGTIERRNWSKLIRAEINSEVLQARQTIHSNEALANEPSNGNLNDENHIIGRYNIFDKYI